MVKADEASSRDGLQNRSVRCRRDGDLCANEEYLYVLSLGRPGRHQAAWSIMSEPDNAHHGGPTGDTDDYPSHEVQKMAHRVALKALVV